jgi:SAM-dependent methyltransferase
MDQTLEILFLLCILISVYILYFRLNKSNHTSRLEGFTSISPFEFKDNQAKYDTFYANLYDTIHKTKPQTHFDFQQILRLTQPNATSNFLDIGSGTGTMVNRIERAGFRAFGLDSSQDMISYATTNHPHNEYIYGDATNTMQFESDTFTHVVCTHFTIYEIEDKPQVFRNIFKWLKPDGVFILHLVDVQKFDCLVPIGKVEGVPNIQDYTPTRVNASSTEFPGFFYTHKYHFLHDHQATQIETFVDKSSSAIRKQETRLMLSPIEDILSLAKQAGFQTKTHINYMDNNHDQHQYLYVLEKS